MNRLNRLTLRGYKTIDCLKDFSPGSFTAFIGPNGAGKSNFISFFRMLSWALGGSDGLPIHVGMQGGAGALLHDGPEVTREIEAELSVRTEAGENQYGFRLVYAAGDTLIFADEKYRFSSAGRSSSARWLEAEPGGRSPQLLSHAMEGDPTAKIIRNLLQRTVVYQFHNTSFTAGMRGKWSAGDNRWLKADGKNLAPFLLRLREEDAKYYKRIVDTLRLILPFFSDFELEETHGSLLLAWRERGCDRVFDASQASDGMLRVVALVTLLLQPERDLPDMLVIDEPELGLHPYAINVVGGLLKSVSTHTQVMVATQSTSLVDCFEPQDIVVVERTNRRSTFRRLEPDDLEEWLEDYSLSELWETNLVGGRP